MKQGKCPKCQSSKVVSNAPVIDRGHLSIVSSLSVQLFKGLNPKPITACVCADCGFTELYVEGAGASWDAHQSQNTRGK